MAFSFVLRAVLEAPGNSRTSEYSTACAVYFSRRSVGVRAPIGPTPNHEPGTSISTAKSTCCWAGYCLTTSICLSIAVDIVVKPAGSPAPPLSEGLNRIFTGRYFHNFFWGHGRAAGGSGSDFKVTGRSTRRRGPRSSGITAWDHTRCSHSALSACKVSGTEC